MLYVLEANPRASRTVPFVSKATAVPLAKAAARVMLGESIASLRAAGVLAAEGDGGDLPPDAPIAVKEAVMPFNRFKTPDGQTVDTVLGPEMRSTGEVMGFDAVFGRAFAKSQAAAYGPLPDDGPGVREHGQPRQADHDLPDQAAGRPRLRDPRDPGHRRGAAAQRDRRAGRAQALRGHRPGRGADHRAADRRRRDRPDRQHAPRRDHGGGSVRTDGYEIRTAAVLANVPCITTVQGLGAAVQGIEAMRAGEIEVRSLQDWAAR